jgi:hypothetical protein
VAATIAVNPVRCKSHTATESLYTVAKAVWWGGGALVWTSATLAIFDHYERSRFFAAVFVKVEAIAAEEIGLRETNPALSRLFGMPRTSLLELLLPFDIELHLPGFDSPFFCLAGSDASIQKRRTEYYAEYKQASSTFMDTYWVAEQNQYDMSRDYFHNHAHLLGLLSGGIMRRHDGGLLDIHYLFIHRGDAANSQRPYVWHVYCEIVCWYVLGRMHVAGFADDHALPVEAYHAERDGSLRKKLAAVAGIDVEDRTCGDNGMFCFPLIFLLDWTRRQLRQYWRGMAACSRQHPFTFRELFSDAGVAYISRRTE